MARCCRTVSYAHLIVARAPRNSRRRQCESAARNRLGSAYSPASKYRGGVRQEVSKSAQTVGPVAIAPVTRLVNCRNASCGSRLAPIRLFSRGPRVALLLPTPDCGKRLTRCVARRLPVSPSPRYLALALTPPRAKTVAPLPQPQSRSLGAPNRYPLRRSIPASRDAIARDLTSYQPEKE